MSEEKIVLFTFVAFLALCGAANAQYHDFPHDIPTPTIPQPVIPIPIPAVPQAIPLPPGGIQDNAAGQATSSSSDDEMSAADRAKRISELEQLTQTMVNELYNMERDYLKVRKLPHQVVGSLEEATYYEGIYENDMQWYTDRIAFVQEQYEADPSLYQSAAQVQWVINNYLSSIREIQGHVDYWKSEQSVRKPAVDEAKVAYNAKNAAYEKLMAELKDLKAGGNTKSGTASAASLEQTEGSEGKETKVVSAGDLGDDVFSSGADAGLSAETVNIKRNQTMQELREEDLGRAFSELGVADKSLTVLETANLAGQVTQTVIGFVPGMDTADVSLSIGRGFAESLGDEIAKGTSIVDALKIAAVNGGIKGTISYIGNEATGGTSAMTNRIAVLSQVGFDKLTTKQIAEMGAKGISYVVIKTGQTITQEVVGAAIDPTVNKIEDNLRDKKKKDEVSSKATKSTTYGSGGGYGSSFATQPLVSY